MTVCDHTHTHKNVLRARRELERDGKDDDTSDGEWAEVQLELIRQVGYYTREKRLHFLCSVCCCPGFFFFFFFVLSLFFFFYELVVLFAYLRRKLPWPGPAIKGRSKPKTRERACGMCVSVYLKFVCVLSNDQLFFSFQERAVVGRASEMRARRGRANDLRRKIVRLEKRAGLPLPSSPSPPTSTSTSTSPSLRECYREDARETFEETSVHPALTSGGEDKTKLTAKEKKSGVGPGGDDMRDYCTTSGFFAEDVVIRDAEGGVRLVPLTMTRKQHQYGHNSSSRSRSNVCTPERGSATDGNSSDSGDGGGDGGRGGNGGLWEWGYGAGRLWRWMRGRGGSTEKKTRNS